MIQAARLTKEMMDRGLQEDYALKSACTQIYCDNQLPTEVREVESCFLSLIKIDLFLLELNNI